MAGRLLARIGSGIVAVAAPVAAWAIITHPEASRPWLPKCSFHELTGLYCPGCGGTRAVFALSNGNLAEAFHCNALWPLSLPLIVVAWVSACAFALRGKGLDLRVRNHRAALAVAAGILTFGILRNIPFYPFTLLAPQSAANSGMMQP